MIFEIAGFWRLCDFELGCGWRGRGALQNNRLEATTESATVLMCCRHTSPFFAAIQLEEFKRNGEMWRSRNRLLVAASGRLSRRSGAAFMVQTGDLIQGDCDDASAHIRMLADCMGVLRAAYPGGLPLLTVVGNHDIRGKGGEAAYFGHIEPFLSDELSRLGVNAGRVKFPVFTFEYGDDLWCFCDFSAKDVSPLVSVLESASGCRHVFLVTHGPFTPPDAMSFRWRLAGGKSYDSSRPLIYELISRRHAIILSGHTHCTSYYRHQNAFGGFCEFTANSVWSKPELATVEAFCRSPASYGEITSNKLKGAQLADFRKTLDLFRPGLKECFCSHAAGHCMLDVSDMGVTVKFYPGSSEIPSQVFSMT